MINDIITPMRKDPFGKKTFFKIMLHNFRNPNPETTKEVEHVKGRGNAKNRVEMLNRQLFPAEREAGWSHFLK